jgi:murein DD-endopeptidase MepM/ murein hydrolase activator NlpD
MQNYIPKGLAILIFDFWILNFMGCATAPLVTPPPPPQGLAGIYHRVEKGQTLWRISKIYNTDLDDLVRINRITEATNIEVGQLIFIPQRKSAQTLSKETLSEDFIWPIKGKVIAAFGESFNRMVNKGINIRPYKTEDVVASRSGRVVFSSDNLKRFSKTIIIDHGDGFSTVYARNAQILVKPGESVQRGTLIAKVGSNSMRDKNTYLHFEIRKSHIPKNPYFYLP